MEGTPCFVIIAVSSLHYEIYLSILASLVIVGGSFVAIAKWAHDKIVDSVKDELNVLSAQVKPNGGSSMRDAIDRIEKETLRQGKELDRQGVELDDVSKRFERHLGFHDGLTKPSK